MRIVSLLPSLTELVCALGHRGDLVGVTHECDFPTGVDELPHLTRSRIPASASSAEIDSMVAEQAGSLYELDAESLSALRPDVILTQSQCDVCAVNESTVRGIAAKLPGSVIVESVNPTDLCGVFAVFRRVGDLLGARAAAESIVEDFRSTAEEIRRRRLGQPVPAVLLLEWLDPPYVAGHWNPEIIAFAGGEERLGRVGSASRRVSWDEVAGADPEVVLASPCGFTLERCRSELNLLEPRTPWQGLVARPGGRIALIDGSAYFSRPGPRLEASLRIAAAAIDSERCGELAESESWEFLKSLGR
jgi:iron complex transport system substrate-binding protein